MSGAKKILLGVWLASFVLQLAFVSVALAADSNKDKKQDPTSLNLTYPDIPGLGRLSDYKKLDEPLRVGFIVSYVFKLVFFVAVGCALIALIVSGVLYIVSSSKPGLLIMAKQWAQNALLGLAILLGACSFLYIVNPQLLGLKLEKPATNNQQTEQLANKYDLGTVVAQAIPITKTVSDALDGLRYKVYVEKDGYGNPTGKYYEAQENNPTRYCYTDGYGTPVDAMGIPIKDLSDDTQANKALKQSNCFVHPAPPVTASSKIFPTALAAPGDDFVYRAEIEIKETVEILRKISEILRGVKDASGNVVSVGLDTLLQKCSCGESRGYTKGQECKGGTDLKGNDFCLNQCDNKVGCGRAKEKDNSLSCDLHDVRKNPDPKKGYEVCISDDGKTATKCEGGKKDCWVQIGTNILITPDSRCGSIKIQVSRLIKYKLLKIQELQVKLEARGRLSSNFLDSLSLAGRVLDINSAVYAADNSQGPDKNRGPLFAFDFENEQEKWKAQGIQVVVETKTGGLANPQQTPLEVPVAYGGTWTAKFLTRLRLLVAPFALAINDSSDNPATVYVITQAPESVQDKEITAENQKMFRESQRFNLFSFLTSLSLETIEGIYKECLTAAFGKADYVLNDEQIGKVLKMAKDSGMLEHLQAAVAKEASKIAQSQIDATKQGIVNDVDLQYIGKFVTQCQTAGECKDKNQTIEKIVGDIKNKKCSVVSNTCCACVQNFLNNSIPPHFVSNTIAGFFTFGLDDAFPKINNLLNTKVGDILFPVDNQGNKKIGKFLNTTMLDIYDPILRGALKTPLNKQIPGLDTLLNKQMKDVLPQFISSQIQGLNTWFGDTINYVKSNAKRDAGKLAQGLLQDYIAKPLDDWALGKFDQMGLGVKNATINGCFAMLDQGYKFNVTPNEIDQYNTAIDKGETPNEIGQCVKMTPEEINGFNLDTKIPQSFKYENDNALEGSRITGINYYTGAFAAQEKICNGSYSWKCGVDVARNESWDFPSITRSSEDCICADIDDLSQDAQSALDIATSKEELGKTIKSGLAKYAASLVTAFTETALRFALAYAQVFVEDNFIAPLVSTWNQITGFQQNIQWFMNATVKEVLPNQVSDLLQENIATILKNFCREYEKKENVDSEGNVKVNMTVNILPNGVTWDNSNNISPIVKVPQKVGDKICHLDLSLGTTVFQELAFSCDANGKEGEWHDACSAIVNTLSAPLKEALNEICYTNDRGEKKCLDAGGWFGKSLIGMLFPHFDSTGIQSFIKATPKGLICGEVPILKQGGTGNLVAPNTQCNGVFQTAQNLIPVMNKENASKAGSALSWCFTSEFLCKVPSNMLFGGKTKWGEFIKQVTTAGCKVYDEFIGKRSEDNKCHENNGSCFCRYNCPQNNLNDVSSCGVEKVACAACSFLGSNSVFYSLLLAAVSSPGYATLDQNQKTKFYGFLWYAFPEREQDIKTVAAKKDIQWENIVREEGDGLGELVRLVRRGLKLNTGSIREALLAQYPILKETPLGVVQQLCDEQIVPMYEQMYPDFVFGAIKGDEIEKIITALPYSVESTRAVTIADEVRAIANLGDDKVNSGLRDGYLFCSILNNTPAQLFGLDLPLKEYIRPEEYKVLFDLFDRELSPGSAADCRKGDNFVWEMRQAMCCDPTLAIGQGLCYKVGERPVGLNQLLDYLNNNTPISALQKLQQNMGDSEAKAVNLNLETTPIVAYVIDIGNCLQVGKAINNCPPYIKETLAINKIETTQTIQKTDIAIPVVGAGDGATKVNAFGYINGPAQGVGDVIVPKIYLVKAQDQSNFVFLFKEPNPAKTNFGDMLSFMDTTVGSLLNSQAQQPIIDYICDSFLADNTAKNPKSICDITDTAELKKKISDIDIFLSMTPLDLLAKYLTKPLELPKQPKTSLMDALAANTALGQPLVDTLGALTGFDQVLFGVDKWADKQAKLAENGALAGVKALQDGLETALVDWPTQGIKSIAEVFGIGLGEKTAAETAGGCYPKPAKGCDSEKEQERVKDGKPECCLLAKANACQPRCRIVDNAIKKCDEKAGEMTKPVSLSIGRLGQNVKACCFEFEKTQSTNKEVCKKCRLINRDAGAKCRGQNQDIKGKDQQGNNLDKDGNIIEEVGGNYCCFYENYSGGLTRQPTAEGAPWAPSTGEEAIVQAGYCCTTVERCITNRLAPSMENLADSIANGKIQLPSLK